MFELGLVAAATMTGYAGLIAVRRGHAAFALLLIVTAIVAGFSAANEPSAGGKAGLFGAVALGAAACLVVIGPTMRLWGRRAMAADRLGAAKLLLDLADLLQPFAGVAEDKAALATLRKVREGQVDEVVTALGKIRSSVAPSIRGVLDARIAMLYLIGDRCDDALAYIDDNLADYQDPETSLPLPAPLWLELIDARARRGELEIATDMVATLENAASDRLDAYTVRHHARVVLLAWAGNHEALAPLLSAKQAPHFAAWERAYWRGLGLQRAGQPSDAIPYLTHALRRARHRLKRRITNAIERPNAAANVTPELFARIAEITSTPLPEPPTVTRRSRLVTPSIIITVLATAIAAQVAVGSIGDFGVATRAGAAVHSMVQSGEWWRLFTGVFVQVGWLPLLFTVMGIWAIGRWSELLFGPARTLAIGGVAGVASLTASSFLDGPGLASGASGVVLGLTAALFAEVLVRREAYRTAWASGLASSMLVVVTSQLAIELSWPTSGHVGHVAALLSGALLGVLFSPRTNFRRLTSYVAVGVALALGAAVLLSAGLLIVTAPATTFARAETQLQIVDGISIPVPANWELIDGQLAHPDLNFHLELAKAADADPVALVAWRAGEPARSRALGLTVGNAAAPIFSLPPGFVGEERVVESRGELGQDQTLRVLTATGSVGQQPVLISLYVPEALAEPLASRLMAMLAAMSLADS